MSQDWKTFEPYIVENGKERSLSFIVEWFYKKNGIPENEAKDITQQYLAAIDALREDLP